MNVKYYNFLESRKKESEKITKRKQEFIGVRREERERILTELLKELENYTATISIDTLKNIIDKLLEKDFEKPHRFC